MFFLKRKTNYLFFIGILITSCNSKPIPNYTINKDSNITKIVVEKNSKVSLVKKNQVKLLINNQVFNGKAYSNAVLPKTSLDVKSYKFFLTKDFNNPFISGANPMGDGVMLELNKSDLVNSVVFNNVPSGGPYYAVAAAFDGVIGEQSSVNITKADLSLQSFDKKWSRSITSVTVAGSSITYSDQTNALNVQLFLEHGVPAVVDTSVSIAKGNPLPIGSELIQ